ncbi:MAG: RCC1 repeat-containing protein, partial [Chloroflexota bacterium]
MKAHRSVWRPLSVMFLGLTLALLPPPPRAESTAAPGVVWGWGNNVDGQIGDGTNTQRLTPVPSLSPSDIISIATGLDPALALTSDGRIWAWGKNNSGQLGNNTTTSTPTPVQVVGFGGTGVLSNVTAIAAGWSSSLALLSDGTVVTWGPNDLGQLGNNTFGGQRLYPGLVLGPGGTGTLSGVTSVSGAEAAHFALKSDGTIWAWGYNNHGKLGIGNTNNQAAPVQVSQGTGLTFATKLVSNARHSFALKSDGTLWAWGENVDGRLGDGSTADKWTPVQIA